MANSQTRLPRACSNSCGNLADSGAQPYLERIREELGGMELADDAEAFAFGRRVIQEVLHRDVKRYAGQTMAIIEGTRAVGSVLCYFYVSPNQKK